MFATRLFLQIVPPWQLLHGNKMNMVCFKSFELTNITKKMMACKTVINHLFFWVPCTDRTSLKCKATPKYTMRSRNSVFSRAAAAPWLLRGKAVTVERKTVNSLKPGSAVYEITNLAFLEASGRSIFTATSRGRPFLTLKGNSRLGRSWGLSISHRCTFMKEKYDSFIITLSTHTSTHYLISFLTSPNCPSPSFSLKIRHWRGSSGRGEASAPGLEEAKAGTA